MRDGTFRNGSYHKFIFLGKRTVKEGECMAIWLLDGRQKIIVGPRRKRLWCSNICFLDRHQVDQNQYIVIYHRNGKREHIRGPFAIFENPVLHQRVEVRNVVSVDGFESLVIYKEDDESGATLGGKVQRRIVQGPCQFVPDANEWIHEFSWSQADAKDKKISFIKLKTIPEQLPFSTQIRTSNDIVLSVSVMLVYELVDIERMLDSTGDPVGDFQNSVAADLLTYGAKVSYEGFLEVSPQTLSCVDTYPLLVQRADSIGFKINKVVYRGYKASQEIQEMREMRIKKESDMRLEDLQFERAANRVKAELELEEARHTKKMQHREAEIRLDEQTKERSNAQQLQFLTELKEMNVDLTKYLLSLNDKTDKVIRVEQLGEESKKTPILINTK